MQQFTEKLPDGAVREFRDVAGHMTLINYGPGILWTTFNNLEPLKGASNTLLLRSLSAIACASDRKLPFTVKMVADGDVLVGAVLGMAMTLSGIGGGQ
jgi:hypothetical protein